MSTRDRYQPLRPLGNAIVVALAIDIAINFAQVLATLGYIGHLRSLIDRHGAQAPLDESAPLVTSELFQAFLGLGTILTFLTLVVLIGIWIHRAAWNVRHLGATGLQYAPGWCVGWYFVPFANLVVPYRAMREIWQASADPQNRRSPAPDMLGAWWGLWLGANIAGNFSMRTYVRAHSLGEYLTSEWLGLLSSVLSLGLSAIFIVIVRRLAVVQEISSALRDAAPAADIDPASESAIQA